jgi:hypothetical protein
VLDIYDYTRLDLDGVFRIVLTWISIVPESTRLNLDEWCLTSDYARQNLDGVFRIVLA